MWYSRCLLVFIIFETSVLSLERDIYIVENNDLEGNEITNNYYRYIYGFKPRKIKSFESEKVSIRVYYECLCPDCIKFDTTSFVPVVKKLSSHLNIDTYPYGNAKTTRRNGEYQFKCQHGPEECYGNKLHACAIDILQNNTQAVLFNSCMMVPRNGNHGSTDEAAEVCGAEQNVESTPIKECAKGTRGTELLKYYGDESQKANFTYVPYILINGKVNDGNNFLKDVCAAFTNPPNECRELTKRSPLEERHVIKMSPGKLYNNYY